MEASFHPLSPISFLEEAALNHGDRISIVYNETKFTWRQTYERCFMLASALFQLQVSPGDIIAAMAPNVPELYELHFGVPMAGGVLSALNTKLDASTLAMKLQHLEPKFFFVDYQLTNVVSKAINLLSQKTIKPPVIVLVPEYGTSSSDIANEAHKMFMFAFNDLLAMPRADDFKIVRPRSEFDPISVNYTSGSTGNPKGAVYSHRAAYLNSLAAMSRYKLRHDSTVFLWTVDMFRCNGWCFSWAMAATGGTNICLRNLSREAIFDAIHSHKVNLLCGPPSLLNIIVQEPSGTSMIKPVPDRVDMVVAGVLPPGNVFEKVEDLGFDIKVGYGMTEALGPALLNPWKLTRRDPLLSTEKEEGKQTKYFEGFNIFKIEGDVDVKDPRTMESVPYDGYTIGEVMLKGNTLMSGYFKSPKATREAFIAGWYRTGDLGIRHQDGYIQIKDRAKYMIITGGKKVSTLEVEAMLLSHPEVMEAAVVGKPDKDLGEVPCAFVKLKEDASSSVSAEELIRFCRDFLAYYMVPQTISFGDLPVNSTGKVLKSVLKEKAKLLMSSHSN